MFKGELSYEEMTRGMVFKELVELRNTRVEQLLEEQKRQEDARREHEREAARNKIMMK